MEGHGGRETEGDRMGANSVVRGAGVEGIEGELGDKEILGEPAIVQAPAGPHDRVGVAANVPGKASARSILLEIARSKLIHQVERAGPLQHAELSRRSPDHTDI